MDSFKGSLASEEAGAAVCQGIYDVLPEARVVMKALADGGEGTIDAVIKEMNGRMTYVDVHAPLRGMVTAKYGIIEETGTAVIEIAQAAGIVLVGTEKDPLKASTYGVGEIIADAVSKGCREFVIGIGGSATNDAGIGMLSALGYRFFDENGNLIFRGADALGLVSYIDGKNVLPELKECHFKILCDVTNPLCGKNGATYIYGMQKGVPREMMQKIDENMHQYAEKAEAFTGKRCMNMPGAGAAGGLGFAFSAFLNAEMLPGIDTVLELTDVKEIMKNTDIVFTGEGCVDGQTAHGKAPVGIAKLAKQYGAMVIALGGSVLEGAEKCNSEGVDAIFSILQKISTLDEALEKQTAAYNLRKTAEQVTRLIVYNNQIK